MNSFLQSRESIRNKEDSLITLKVNSFMLQQDEGWKKQFLFLLYSFLHIPFISVVAKAGVFVYCI